MILVQLSDYLKHHGRASTLDMVQVLNVSPDALREMLTLLERKGCVRKLSAGTSCGGGCSKCRPQDIELYEWAA